MSRHVGRTGWLAALLFSCVAQATNWSAQTHDLYPGDFNGDARDDLLVVARDPAGLSGIFTASGGQPSVQLQSWNSGFLGINWHSNNFSVVVADFDANNRDDVLLQRNGSGNSFLLLANSEGKLHAIHQVIADSYLSLGWTQRRIVAGDFNGDGRDELLLQPRQASVNTAIVASNASGQLTSVSQSWPNNHLGFKWSTSNSVVHVGDFNADNRDDLLIQAKADIVLVDYDVPIPVPVFKPQSFGLTLATAAGQFTSIQQLWSRKDFGVDWAPGSADVVIGDFNGDNRDDVLLVGLKSGQSSYLLLANTNGQISSSPVQTFTPGTSGTNWSGADYRMFAADFTGDGRAELYRQALAPAGTNSIASFTASGTLSAVTTHNAPSISNGLTTAIGRLPGEFSVGANGGAEYEIPLDLPAGTNGLKPSLSFQYSSQSGNGLLGMGWGLSGLSAITLCPKTLDQDGVIEGVSSASPRYCLDGNKLRTTNGIAYGGQGATYQTEVDVFSRITSYTSGAPGFTPMFGPQYFRVEGKDGLYYFYGYSESGRIEQGSPVTLRAWALDRIEDRNGNYMTIAYTKGVAPGGWLDGSFRPSLIEWARTAASQGPYFKAIFQYENRPDVETGFFGGASITENKRLDYVEIQSFENSAWGVVRKYDATYEGTLSSANHSRLASVTQCSASECLPATTFQYQNGASGWPSSDTFDSLATAAMLNSYTIDLDGDARDDLVYPDGGFWKVRLSNGSSYGLTVTSSIATGSAGPTAPYQFALPIDYYANGRRQLLVNVPSFANVQLLQWTGSNLTAVNTNIAYTMVGKEWIGDADGDGRQDFIQSSASGLVASLTARLNTGDPGGAFGAAQQIFSYSGGSVSWGGFGNGSDHVMDLNGDGKMDFMFITVIGGCGEIGCINEASWNFVTSSVSGYAVTGATPNCTPTLTACGDVATVGDFNGDGLSDAITAQQDGSGNVQWLLNTGTGAGGVGGSYITLPSTFYGSTRRIVDYDHDGRDDILFQQMLPSQTGSWYVLRSNGTGFDPAVATSLPTGTSVNAVRILDVDADGQQDIGYRTTTWRVRKHLGSYPDLLTRATDGLGNYVAPVYAPLTDSTVYTKGSSTAYPYVDVLTPMYVVKNYAASTGIASPAEYSVAYKYEAGRVQLKGRGFVGFGKRTRTDTRTASPLITVETSRQDFPYIGNPGSTITYQSDGVTKISELAYTYDKKDLAITSGNTRVAPFVSQTIETKYEVGAAPYNGQATTRSTTTNTYDNFGNVTGQTQLAEDLHSSPPLNGAQYQTQTVNTVVNDTGVNWCVGAVTRGELKSKPHGQASFVTRTKSYVIDYAKCRMTQEKVEPDIAALRVTTDIAYYTNGQIQSRTVTGNGMTPRQTTFEYHAAGPYITKQTNALSQFVQAEWAVGLGVETARIDINGQRIDWGYDTLGRKINERAPDGTRTDFSYFPCQTGCGYPTGRYQIVSVDSAGGVTSAQSASVFDMMGREIQSTNWMIGGAQSHVLIDYDAMGRAFRTSAPFWTGGSVYWTTQTYDVIGRPKSETRPVSESDGTLQSTTWDYEGLRTRQTDPQAKIVLRRTNALGQVVQMTDSASGYTWYEYDAWGNNTKTYMGDQNGVLTPGTAIVTVYDLRGRKQSSTDPDMGSWLYTFNPLDELIVQTDAKNQSVIMEYDLLGRMKKRTEPEGDTTITFDTATNGKGKVHTISAPSGVTANGYLETRAYDTLGRSTTTTTTVDGNAYAVTVAYNTAGQIDTVEYPQSHPVGYRFKVRYSYDFGHLKQVKDAVAGTVYWTAVDSSPAGEVATETLGNGIGISSWHDAVSGVLRQRYSGPGYNGTVQALQYQWDRNANLTQRSDTNQGYTENFIYDSLYRLDYSTLTTGGTTVTNLDVNYNAIGNITFMTGVGTYTYGHATKKHAVTATSGGASLPTSAFVYDANGNMTTRAGSTNDWYSYNLPKVLRQGTDTSEFFYGPSRERFKQIAVDGGSTETTIYIGGLLERVTKPSGVIEYKHNIAGDGSVVASYTRRSNAIYDTRYFTTDHLGSIDTISNESGTVLTRLSYDAFGKRRNFTGAAPGVVAAVTHRGFTGHEMLDNVDLIHMNGRVYDPLVGRFLSPDPFVTEPYSSQALNRYTYVDNNPLSHTDPSGYSKLSSAWRKLERAVKRFVRKFFAELVALVVTYACMAVTEGGGGPACASAGASAGDVVRTVGRVTTEPILDAPYIGTAESGVSLPPGTIVFLGVPGSAADVSQPQAQDLMGDPLFATIVDILGGLIPGYDLFKVYNDPNATMLDWVAAIGTTVLSVTPFKALTLANKIIRAVKSARAGRVAAKAASSLCCFAAGTPVETDAGPRPIETLRSGDRVLSRNEETGETAYQPITEILVNDQHSLWELQIVDSTGAIETHRVTYNHPYWVVGVGWVGVANLKSGMQLETADGTGANVVSLVDTKRVERTYNLEVANFHTYFAGEDRILVHNGAGCKLPDLSVDAAKAKTRIRHYTNKQGIDGIEGSGVIHASDQNRVFAESARRRALSARNAEDKYGLKRGRGRNFVETDVASDRVKRRANPLTGADELTVEGDVVLSNPTIVRRR